MGFSEGLKFFVNNFLIFLLLLGGLWELSFFLSCSISFLKIRNVIALPERSTKVCMKHELYYINMLYKKVRVMSL